MSPRRRAPRPGESKEWLLAVRIPESLDQRLDAFCESLRIEVPWVRMTRSDVVRWLLKAQLEALGDYEAS